ncbi:MAG TPA: hypothetical protein VHB21_28165 [Minicystis sp.]|nr:hypothetical protein [Minicystis sp.]
MGTTLALTKIDFGEGNSGEWKKIGFNIDGLNSTATSTDVCMPSSGGSADMAYPDGDNGIDNSFGKNLLPIIISAYPTWPTDVNTNIQKGAFNAMFKMYCLPPKGDVPVMTTKLFGGTDLGMTPKFDGTDVWPVAPELLADPMDPESSTIVFDMSSVKGQLFDTGKDQMFILTLPMASQQRSTTIKLTLHAAQVKMTLSADRKSATGGVIGGVLDTEEFLTEVKKIGWTFGLCGSALYDSIVNQVRQSSDIMNDGTQDSSKTCNGISIGLGFEMKEVQLGDVGPKATMGGSCQ